MFGRRRLVPELTSRNGQIRSAAERVAVNLPIQGSAADIMKRAMLQVHAALGSDREARMILTVHDELLFEVPKARAEEIGALVRERMESAAELKVPLTVDVGIGDLKDENWSRTSEGYIRSHVWVSIVDYDRSTSFPHACGRSAPGQRVIPPPSNRSPTRCCRRARRSRR